jgi:hypothetical protein
MVAVAEGTPGMRDATLSTRLDFSWKHSGIFFIDIQQDGSAQQVRLAGTKWLHNMLNINVLI